MKTNDFNYEEGFMGVREEKPESYFRSFAQDYRLRSLVNAIKLDKGKLLDIGCGGGIFTESLPYYYPRAELYGCDVSKTAINYAKKLGSGKVKYSVIKNKKLPYKNNFFDVCICFDVLEHVPDADFLLNEVKRILKKGGKFFLIVPCEGEKFTYTWVFQKTAFCKNLTYRYFGHIHPEFTHKYIIKLLQNHGFNINKKSYSEHSFYQIMHLFIFFLPKILLEIFLGKEKSNEYSNSSLIRVPKNKTNLLMVIRKLWFVFFNFMMMYPMSWETVVLRKFPPTAWKLHVLASKN